jgi:hypothetical protein
MMECIKAASIMKCSALTRLACQFDGVDESTKHFGMLGTPKARVTKMMEWIKAAGHLEMLSTHRAGLPAN